MRNLAATLFICAITLGLSACGLLSGNAASVEPTLTPLPTNPTANTASPTAAVIQVDHEQALREARQALAAGDFSTAVGIVAPLADSNPDAAALLAESHLAWGRAIIAEANGNLERLRVAFDHLGLARYSVPVQSDLTKTIDQEFRTTGAYLDTSRELARLKEINDSDNAARQAQAERLLELAAPLAESAWAAALYRQVLLEVAPVFESLGDRSQERQAKVEWWRRALQLCQQAAERSEAGSKEADKANECVTRLNRKLTPPTPTPTPTPRPRPTNPSPPPAPAPPPAANALLRVSLLNYNDEPNCISMRITGIDTSGWTFVVHGLNAVARFQGGDARTCSLAAYQEVHISVRDAQGQVVPGGGGIPAKGSAILIGVWK